MLSVSFTLFSCHSTGGVLHCDLPVCNAVDFTGQRGHAAGSVPRDQVLSLSRLGTVSGPAGMITSFSSTAILKILLVMTRKGHSELAKI